MSRPKTSNLYLGPLGAFHSGGGRDVDYVHLPAIVTSRAAGLHVVCEDAEDLRRVLTAHWEASGRTFCVDDVLAWAMDQLPPMTAYAATSSLRYVAVDPDWLRYRQKEKGGRPCKATSRPFMPTSNHNARSQYTGNAPYFRNAAALVEKIFPQYQSFELGFSAIFRLP